MNRLLRTIWLFMVLAAAPALGAEFIALEDECNGRQLLIQGPIEAGDLGRLHSRLAALVEPASLPEVQNLDVLWTVKLDSPGGDLDEAMRMGRFLRRSLAATEVSYRFAPRADGVYDFARTEEQVCLEGSGRMGGCARDLVEAECAGACLLVWLGGAERYALEGRLGRHGLAGADEPVADYLEEMGLRPARVRELLAAASRPTEWLGWPERQALSEPARELLALLADCPPPLSVEESFASVVGEPAAREALLDRARARRACRQRQTADTRRRALE